MVFREEDLNIKKCFVFSAEATIKDMIILYMKNKLKNLLVVVGKEDFTRPAERLLPVGKYGEVGCPAIKYSRFQLVSENMKTRLHEKSVTDHCV